MPMKQGSKQPNSGPPDGRRRAIEFRIISAQDLKDVRLVGRMKTYAVAYVDSEHTARTRVDEKNGANPIWNESLTVSAAEDRLKDSLAYLTIDIFSQGPIRDTLVGTVRILLSDALKGGETANPIRCLSSWVRLPCGDVQGILNVWVPINGQFSRNRGSE